MTHIADFMKEAGEDWTAMAQLVPSGEAAEGSSMPGRFTRHLTESARREVTEEKQRQEFLGGLSAAAPARGFLTDY